MLKLRVDLGKWILIDKQGHPQQTTWQKNGYDSAVYGFVPGGSLLACVQDPKRIEIMDILELPNLGRSQNTKIRPTESAPDQYTPLLQSRPPFPNLDISQNDGSTFFCTDGRKIAFSYLGCILAILIAMFLLYLVTGLASLSYSLGFLLMLGLLLFYLYDPNYSDCIVTAGTAPIPDSLVQIF